MKKSERKIIYRWSASIFLVVIIPVVFGCILYAYSMKNIRQKSEETNRQLILEKEGKLNQICEEFNELSSRLMADSNVNAILKGAFTKADGTDISLQTQRLLQEKQREKPMLRGIYLYFPWSGTVLGDSYCFDIMGNEEYVYRKLLMERDAFFEMLSGSIMNTVHLVGGEGEAGQQMLYISTLRDNVSFMDQKIIVLFYFDTSYFDQSFRSEGMNLYIEDKAGEVYQIVSEEEQIGIKEIRQIDFAGEAFWWKGGCCVSKTELSYYDLTLYTVQQEVRYRRELQNMMWLLGGYIVLCAILGGLLSYLISRWNYKPIGELAAMLSRHKKEEEGAGWEAMQESVRQLMKGYEQERERSRSMDEVMRDIRMSRILVKGEPLSKVEAEERLELGSGTKKEEAGGAYGETDGKGEFVVVSFDAEELVLEGQEEGAWSKEQDRKLIYFIIENVATELLGESCCHRSGSIEDLYYFILWKPEGLKDAPKSLIDLDTRDGWKDAETFLEEIRGRMLRLCSFFEESYQLRVCVNISRLAAEEGELHQCYQDVLCLTQYRSQVGSEETLLLYSDRDKNPSLEEFEDYWMTCERVDDLLREQQMEEAAKRLLEWLSAKGSAAGQDSGEHKRGQGQEKRKSQETSERLEQVLAYIEGNYCDAQITVGAIAERFGIHISTLSRDMKTKKGVGVLEYIGSLRLRRAKELLAEGLSVGDTAKEVGFYSSRPLVRLFQEREGVTPAQYSRMLGKFEK